MYKNEECAIEIITPKQAKVWLATQGKNRKMSKIRIDLYEAMIKRGDWFVTNQGIALSPAGKLLDGQHRLSAIIQANQSAKMLVVRGVKTAAQLVLDQPLVRRPHEQISLREGWDVSIKHIAVAKEMVRSVGFSKASDRTIRDILLIERFYRQHHKAVEFATALFLPHASIQGVTIAPVFAPVARAFYKEDRSRLVTFAEIMCTGLTARAGDSAALVLRNWLIGMRDRRISSRRLGDRRLIYKKAEMALKAFLQKQTVTALPRDLNTELFPIPNDVRVLKKEEPTISEFGSKLKFAIGA